MSSSIWNGPQKPPSLQPVHSVPLQAGSVSLFLASRSRFGSRTCLEAWAYVRMNASASSRSVMSRRPPSSSMACQRYAEKRRRILGSAVFFHGLPALR